MAAPRLTDGIINDHEPIYRLRYDIKCIFDLCDQINVQFFSFLVCLINIDSKDQAG